MPCAHRGPPPNSNAVAAKPSNSASGICPCTGRGPTGGRSPLRPALEACLSAPGGRGASGAAGARPAAEADRRLASGTHAGAEDPEGSGGRRLSDWALDLSTDRPVRSSAHKASLHLRSHYVVGEVGAHLLEVSDQSSFGDIDEEARLAQRVERALHNLGCPQLRHRFGSDDSRLHPSRLAPSELERLPLKHRHHWRRRVCLSWPLPVGRKRSQ